MRYIRQHKRLLYTNLLTSIKLNSYLGNIDWQAKELFFRQVKQMAEREGCDGRTQGIKSNEMGRTDEQYSSNSKRGCSSRNHIRMRSAVGGYFSECSPLFAI